jgi:hypothetical protein
MSVNQDGSEAASNGAKDCARFNPDAVLHPSVLECFSAKDGVQHFYEQALYRPRNLARHSKVWECANSRDHGGHPSPTARPSWRASSMIAAGTQVEGADRDRTAWRNANSKLRGKAVQESCEWNAGIQ